MKFSIIIPCYNEKDNMDNLIVRISHLQTKFELEYILVENGSNDGSKEYFMNHIEGKFPGIEVVYVEKNRGYGYGIQQGIKKACGEYIGWIHADLQVRPEELIKFFKCVDKMPNEKIFFKARRTNRRFAEMIFTHGQSIFSSCLFGARLYDIGAIPMLFHRSLIDKVGINSMPNDFSIDLYVYVKAVQFGYTVRRFTVKMVQREGGVSSWNHGFTSRIRQSGRIIRNSIMIKRGRKVL